MKEHRKVYEEWLEHANSDRDHDYIPDIMWVLAQTNDRYESLAQLLRELNRLFLAVVDQQTFIIAIARSKYWKLLLKE